MDEPEQVWRGGPEAARSLAKLLHARGITCHVADRPQINPRTGVSSAVDATVSVPAEQVEAARAIRDEWVAASVLRAHGLTRRIIRITALSVAPPALWLVASMVWPGSITSPSGSWLVALWWVSIIVIAQLEHRRHGRERLPRPDGSGGWTG